MSGGDEIESGPDGIAIIGMSGRFPKAADLDEYWENIKDGVECISFPSEPDSAAEDEVRDPYFVNAGGVLDDIDLFDASFFGFSARDAAAMDPQQRIFLECAWHSLEEAGYNPNSYPDLIGVFAGAALSSYMSDIYTSAEALSSLDDFQIAIGNDKDHLTTQVSYRLNMRGPSLTIQTACSTSLVSVCMACQSLLNYQCDLALAGGVSADISTGRGYYYQPGGIFSPDGRCRAFDAAAQGTVAGNGVGIVVLKRLSEAVADRDRIRAVIKGFAVNNDGSRKVGYTAPSISGQAEAIALAQAVAGVEARTITYIEAHGTGTPLGDPIEMAALDQVFSASTRKKGFCAVGSVKGNIGHLDTAAGIAGLIKTVLALEHRMLPPSLHYNRPNPKIDFASSAFYVNTKLAEWESTDGPRRAGVSSFGIGGTNAHVVLEESPPPQPSRYSRPYCLLAVSARTASALEIATDSLVSHLSRHPDADLADVAYTYQVGRRGFEHRRAVVCESGNTDGAREALETRNPLRVLSGICKSGEDRPVFFMFPGQGAQDSDMAAEIYRTEPTFRKCVDHCCEVLRPLLGFELRELLYPEPERRGDTATALRRTAYAQPALFTIEYALARLWMEWGIAPAGLIGHSIGEYVAACLAEVFSLEDALKLVALRGQLMDRMPPGAMLAVPLSEMAAQQHLIGQVCLAAVNGSASCVLSGPSEEVDQMARQLSAVGMQSYRLPVSHAFHSTMMEPAVDPFVRVVQTLPAKAPKIPYISNLTGTWITAEAATEARYWGAQMRRSVRFSDGLEQLYQSQGCILLEVGPGQALSGLARQHPARNMQQVVLSSLSPAAYSISDAECLLTTLGKLWLHGIDASWKAFSAHEEHNRVSLPTYPFERQSYRIGPTEYEETDDNAEQTQEKRHITEWFYYPMWKRAVPWESSHQTKEDKPKSRWLVFDDSTSISAQLILALKRNGDEVTNIKTGTEFGQISECTYSIRPDQPGDYERMLRDIQMRGGFPNAIAHLWSLTSGRAQRPSESNFDEAQRLGFYSVTFLVQALTRLNVIHQVQLNVVSNQIQTVTGNEALRPPKATLLGACKVIPQEHSNMPCRIIDIDYDPARGPDERRIVSPLLAELTVAPFEPTVAYRKGRRWVQIFEATRIDGGTENAARARPGGVYLITGGLGKIGLVIARALAKTVRAKLILTGRSEFPEPSQWENWLAVDPESDTSARIRTLLELQELGADVTYVRADSADRAQMRHAIYEAESRYGPINGVIHGAGDTESYVPVNRLDQAAADSQFRPKASGVIVLDKLLRRKDLDFCLLLSSISSFLGGLGLAAYSAANCFMDAMASQRNQKDSVPWISVNWDAWQFTGGDETAGQESHHTIRHILPWEGEEALEYILSRAPHQIVVSTTDLHKRYDEWVRLDSVRTGPETRASRTTKHGRPNLANPYVAPRSDMEDTLAEIWQQLLGVTPVGSFDNFFELGGHSLLAVQLSSRLREKLQIEVPVQQVFEFPTIAGLAESFDTDRIAAADDDAKAARLLHFVERLSQSEVSELLEEEYESVQEKGPPYG